MYLFQALKMFFHTLFLLIQHMSPFYCYRKHIIIASRTASTLALVSSPVQLIRFKTYINTMEECSVTEMQKTS